MKEDKKEKSGDFIKNIMFIVLALVIAILIRKYVFSTHIVKGASMEDTLHSGDFIITNNLSLVFGNPDREDIVVVKDPSGGKTWGVFDRLVVKRVIGLPGDEIDLNEGKFYINSELLQEEYEAEDSWTMTSVGNHWELAEDEYFIVGDNRNLGKSYDSRAYGPVDRDLICGRANVRLFPFDKMGKI